MNLLVEVKNINGNITPNCKPMNLSKPAFVKHMALSGYHFVPNMQKLFRYIGMFFHYGYYLQKKSFDNDSFSVPPDCIYDPTEKSQFSNLAGRAIADFLSKRIDKSIFTVNYEAVMEVRKNKIKGKRPDLLAFPKNSMFAIEAKGYSKSITEKDMEEYKEQSRCGEIFVNFCVASVSHNLYRKVKCKYHKSPPPNNNYSYRERQHILKELSRNYYSTFLKFMDESYLHKEVVKFSNEEFYKIDLSYEYFEEYFSEIPLKIWLREIFNFYKPKLIITKNVEIYAKEGLTDNVVSFEFDNNRNIYIDNDRIGIELNCDKEESFENWFEKKQIEIKKANDLQELVYLNSFTISEQGTRMNQFEERLDKLEKMLKEKESKENQNGV